MTSGSASPAPDVSVPPRKRPLRHVGPILLRYKWHLGGATFLVAVHGLAMGLQNTYPKWLFSDVLEPTGLTLEDRWRRLAWLIAGYLVISVLLRMVAWHSGYRLFTWARERLVFALRGQFFRHVNHLCLRFHGEHSSGELFSYLFGSPLQNVMQFFQHASMFVPGAIVTVVYMLAFFWWYDPVVALLLMMTSVVNVILMLRARERMQRLNADYQSAEGDVSGRVADLLRGNRAVKLYAMERRVEQDFDEQALAIGRKSYERDVKGHVEWMKSETFGYLCYSAVLGVCTWRYVGGHIGVPVVAACLTSYVGLQWPMQVLFQAFTFWGGAAASLERIGAVLDTASSTPEPTGEVLPVPPHAELQFERVTFGYEPGTPVLRDIDLVIPAGQRVALVGPSGAGKSTFAQLLLRLYDPTSGVVRLGGVDVRRFVGSELRRRFGVVPQDPFIFRATVRDNVRVARPDASDAAIRYACEQANAREFIARLPGGLDAQVGEGGSTLSGGQRQRLAIARALLAEPAAFIFDEATSALDTLSEQLIQDALERNLGGRTVVFIAHRLATVRHCDRLLVVDGGRVVQDGTYATLAEADGLFRELVRGQSLRD